ncbi:TPA: DNA helicase [Bacillus pseudomycoides]|nr:DNA helicase [Bacillus pseudomycoides]
MPEKTLKKIENDIQNNNLGKARDRLHGLISTYPNVLDLRKKLGDIYYKLQHPAMAGRYWYLEEQKTPEMIEACSLFEKSMRNDAKQIVRALKFKGDNEIIQKLCSEPIASSLQKKVKEKIIEEPEETWQDKLIPFGCISAFILIILFALLGIYTAFDWIF